MTREDIICMAREAGFEYSGAELSWESVICTEELERFASLVARQERKRISQKIEQLPFGDTAASFGVYVREA